MKKAKKKNLYPAAGAKGAEELFATEVPEEKKDVGVPGASGRIGTDESGKGDYFGGLVIAGVYLNEDLEKKISKFGIKDSKKLSDKRIFIIADSLKQAVPYSIVRIYPEKYNELYDKMQNLNKNNLS